MVRQTMDSEKVDKTLPRRCLVLLEPYTETAGGKDKQGAPAIIRRGENQVYLLASFPLMTASMCKSLNQYLLDCTVSQTAAMFHGATHDWSEPAAFASYWEDFDKK